MRNIEADTQELFNRLAKRYKGQSVQVAKSALKRE